MAGYVDWLDGTNSSLEVTATYIARMDWGGRGGGKEVHAYCVPAVAYRPLRLNFLVTRIDGMCIPAAVDGPLLNSLGV